MPKGINDIVDWATVLKNSNVKIVDWMVLSELYEVHVEEITDTFYKLTDATLQSLMRNNAKENTEAD